MLEVREIHEARRADIRLPNEPFPLFGRMEVSRVDGQWSHQEVLFAADQVSEMCFPDENYDYDAMKRDCVFLGVYDGEQCVGLAVLQEAMFKYLYLYDLKVSRAYRGQGAARALIEKSSEVSKARGYRGLYTIGQDDNLGACRFYLQAGFRIGGLDTEVYKGTKQEGKSDILFYLDL